MLLLPCLVVPLLAASQTWTQLPDFPGTPRDDAASFTLWDKVYVGTGLDAGFQLTNDWHAFDVLAGTWSGAPSLPSSGRQYSAGFALEGFGFLFGGLSSAGPLNELWRFDPSNSTWTAAAPLPSTGRYAATVITSGSRAWICGGLLEGGVPTNETWCYDRPTDTWTPASSLPGQARHRATAIGLMVVGGADADYQALSDAHRYDPVNDAWTPAATLPAPRFAADGVEQLVIGGASSNSSVHADCWWYDDLNNDWASMSIPAFAGGPRRGGVTGTNLVLADAFMVFYGTGSDNVQRYADWWRFDMPVGMADHNAGTVRIYPVPVSTLLTIDMTGGMGTELLHVFDARGVEVMRFKHQPPRSTIDASALANGTYVICSQGARAWQHRFVVLH